MHAASRQMSAVWDGLPCTLHSGVQCKPFSSRASPAVPTPGSVPGQSGPPTPPRSAQAPHTGQSADGIGHRSGMLDFNGSVLLEEGVTARDFLDRLIEESHGTDNTDAFFVADLGEVVKKHLHFLKALPRVKPFYAVKCNSSPEVVRTLAQLGTGFDCASKTELELVQGFGVAPDRIIYANPCKQLSHIQHAARTGVTMMTFDSESELDKISSSHPDARMILRIAADDSRATLALSPKFGAELSACRHLLEVAKRLRVEVIGVSFHVGSVTIDPQTFAQSIADAGVVFALGKELGHDMHLLDIGGGFPGSGDYYKEFEKISAVINTALDKHFPEGCGVEVVAEPGRYYVASAFTLAVNIIGKKELPLEETGLDEGRHSGSKSFEYYLNDGMYGSFFHVSFEKPVLNPSLHKVSSLDQPLYASRLWGHSSKQMDRIVDGLLLPELMVGEWLIFENFGAYTASIAFTFNGLQPPGTHHVLPQWAWKVMQLDPEALLHLSHSMGKVMLV